MKGMDRGVLQRGMTLAFWLLILAVIGMILSKLVGAGMADSFENQFLDMRLRERARLMMPSEDIVILGLDRKTVEAGREDPKLGLTNLYFSRKTMGEMVDYLRKDGVKAVVIDLEFRDDTPNDKEFAAVLAKTPNVFAANRLEDELSAFSHSIEQDFMGNNQNYQSTLVYQSYIPPYILYWSQVQHRFLGRAALTPLDFGLDGYVWKEGVPPLINQYIVYNDFRNLAFQDKHSPVFKTPEIEKKTYGNPNMRSAIDLCNGHQQRLYRYDPQVLKRALDKQAPFEVSETLDDATLLDITRCYTFPVAKPIMESLKGVGIPSVNYDKNGFIRSVPSIYQGYLGSYYTYLGIRPALDLMGVKAAGFKRGQLTLGEKDIPLVNGTALIVNWRNPALLVKRMYDHRADQIVAEIERRQSKGLRFTEVHYPSEKYLSEIKNSVSNAPLTGGHMYRTIPMISLLNKIKYNNQGDLRYDLYNIPQIPESGEFSFKDKIVIIGNTYTDIHRSPISNITPGPEIVANVLDQVLNDTNFVHKAPVWLEVIIVTVLLLAIASAIINFEQFVVGFTVGTMLIIFYCVANIALFVYYGLWLTMGLSIATLLLGLVGATLYRYYVHDREKNELTHVFSRYVSPQVMKEIVKNPSQAMENLRGEKKELTVLFADLQGFTQQFENADPEMMVQQLNEYLDTMTDVILDHGGTYDKYMGDAVMAFFGAPSELKDHAQAACDAAVEMQNRLHQLNQQWTAQGRKTLAHGIGISSGEMFVGNFGSRNIKNFTVMGNNVNLGARLEAYTRVAAWPIIISLRTYDLTIPRIKARDLGKIRVKGFTDPIQCFGLEGVYSEKNEFYGWQLDSMPAPQETEA